MSELSLKDKAKKGEVAFYLQFGGQGTPWFRELARYYKKPGFQTFFETAFQCIEEERHRVEGTIGLPHGIPLQSWLEEKENIPSDEYLSHAAVSLPLVQLTQMAHIENLRIEGVSHKELLSWSLGATGHSQGIVSSVLFCLGYEGSAYYKALAQFTKYQLYLGVSAQKVYPYLTATPEEVDEAKNLGGGIPSPMVAVLGSDHASIEKLIKEINKELPEDRKIYVSLYNSPTNRILSSYRSSLLAFQKKYNHLITEKQFKLVYLQASCPFHCPLMKPIRTIMDKEIEHIQFTVNHKDIQLPIYSFYNDDNYQEIASDLPKRMYEDLMINPLYWDKAMKAIAQNVKVTHVLDFGPGKTTQRLSTDSLTSLGPGLASEKKVIGLAKDTKAFLL